MNVHILKGKLTEKSGSVLQGSFDVVFHIPIYSPVTGIVETPISQVPDIEQTEIDALAVGTLIEVREDWNYTSNKKDNDYRQQLKDRKIGGMN